MDHFDQFWGQPWHLWPAPAAFALGGTVDATGPLALERKAGSG